MIIRPATPEDAPLIGKAVTMAIGEEITESLAGEHHTMPDVEALFAYLAGRDDTQYSYLNTLVCVDDEGKACGVCVAYDGAGLHEMRQHFFRAAKERLGRDMTAMEDECTADEIYLDTLAVMPGYRGKGYAMDLIKATAERASNMGKPLGLLVEKENAPAKALYAKAGFEYFDERPFAFVLMDHLRLPQ